MQHGTSRNSMYGDIVSSQEFLSNPINADKSTFVNRTYQAILKRMPTAAEIQQQVALLQTYDGQGRGIGWPVFIEDIYSSVEFKDTQCQTGYYSLGAPVNISSILLEDLFNGIARMQSGAESVTVTLNVPDAVALWDQKLPVLHDPFTELPIAFTRVCVTNTPQLFNIALLTADDPSGLAFTEVGMLFDTSGGRTFYDPHISVDNSVCPPQYIMSMECIGNEGAASHCISFTTTPSLPETWSNPFVIVDGCTSGNGGVCHATAAQSASTGVTLIDGKNRYVAWTDVYDGSGPNDPLQRTFSQNAGPIPSFSTYFGSVLHGSSPIYTLMSAEPHPYCTDAWDCNNRDKQDWKREGSYYYALYNGANYFRCDGLWGISVSRSTTVDGTEYTDRLPLAQGIEILSIIPPLF